RSGRFMPMARKIFREVGVPEDITWLGQIESAWQPRAMSWAAASGLWQFVPSTGSRFGLRQTAWVDERNSFEKATRASAMYLKWLATRYNGNWELAIAAYNTGEGNIDRAIQRAGACGSWQTVRRALEARAGGAPRDGESDLGHAGRRFGCGRRAHRRERRATSVVECER